MMQKTLCRHWWKSEEGVVALEFALIAIPFTYLLLGIVEIALMFAASSMLQAGTGEAVRQVRTGQLQQSAGDPQAQFRDRLCDYVETFIPCADIGIEAVDIQNFSSASDYDPQFDANSDFVSRGFNLGGSGEVMLVRTVYRYPLITPFFAQAFADGPNDTRLFVSTVVLEVEPYEFGGGSS